MANGCAMKHSAIVIGGGIAGLSAAHHLSARGIGVTVLEASERVGGRMTSERHDGFVIDRGAQFVSDGYTVVADLIDTLGLSAQVHGVPGWTGIVRGGKVRRIHPRRPWTLPSSGLLRWKDAVRTTRASLKLAHDARDLPLNDYAGWRPLDREDAAHALAERFGTDALEYLFEPMLEGFYFQPPEGTALALPAMVWSFGARGKSVSALRGGMGVLPETLATRLDVRLSSPAVSIESGATGVQVATPHGTFRADFAVLATTAGVARGLCSPVDEDAARLLDTRYSATVNISLGIPAGIPSAPSVEDIYAVLIPRRERRVLAAFAFQSRKYPDQAGRGELLNVMLDGATGARLIGASESDVMAEVIPELERYLPGVASRIGFTRIHRWLEAEPCSPPGRATHLHAYRQKWRADRRVVLAGDYMGIPCTEGAAESGRWAAAQIAGALAGNA
jgi:oxygen-dependent protoporphyrinogen oxidase